MADDDTGRLMRVPRAVGPTRGERRVIGERRSGSHDDRVDPGAPLMGVGTCRRTGDPLTGAVGRGDTAVDRGREFHRDERSSRRLPVQPRLQRAGGDLVREYAGIDAHTRCAQRVGSAGRRRIGVGHTETHVRHARRDECLRTRSGAPGVVARLECHHRGCAACGRTGLGERGDLGMRAARRCRVPDADDRPGTVDDDRAHRWVGGTDPLCGSRFGDRLPHQGGYVHVGQFVPALRACAACSRSFATATPGSAAP